MSRASLVGLVMASLLLLAAPAGGMVLAADDDEPQLLAGALKEKDGKPAEGRVLVFHDNLRDENRLELVSTTRSNASGLFSIGFKTNPSVENARKNNGGFAHFSVYGVTDAGVSLMRFFSAELGATSWKGNGNDELDNLNLIATQPPPVEDFAGKVERSDPIRKLAARRHKRSSYSVAASYYPTNCYYDLIATLNKQVPVHELHTAYADLSGKAYYGRTNKADSDISVGFKVSPQDTIFNASGALRVSNSFSETVETSRTRTGNYGYVLSTSFKFSRWRNNEAMNRFNALCSPPSAPYEVLEATRWNGTTFSNAWDDSRFNGKCLTTWYSHRDGLQRGEEWKRSRQNFTSYGFDFSVSAGISASMTAKSGASDMVGIEYKAGTARSVYWICGNTDFPAYSLRIFAGGG